MTLVLNNIDNIPSKTKVENSIIKPFISEAPYTDIYSILEDYTIKQIISDYFADYIKACVREYEIFDKGYKHLSTDQKGQIILSMLPVNIDFSIKAVKKSNYVFGDVVVVVNEFFNRLPSVDDQQKENIFEIAYKTHCGNDPTLEERFYSELKGIKGTPFGDDMIKKYVKKRGGLFSKSQRDDLLNITLVV